MLERIRSLISDDRMRDTLKVALPNGGTLLLIHLAEIKLLFELGLILLTISHTVWRWRKDARKHDESSRK